MAPGIVAESDLSGNLQSEYVFFDGERVARRDNPSSSGPVFYYFSDHLKTASVITDASGNIKAESDYYPWGGELQFTANDSNHYKFTGKERDSESGLDYFGARYYSNGLGRFITPDWADRATAVPYAEFSDPQSLNLYTYVRNVPTTRLDLDGHDVNDLAFSGAVVGVESSRETQNSASPDCPGLANCRIDNVRPPEQPARGNAAPFPVVIGGSSALAGTAALASAGALVITAAYAFITRTEDAYVANQHDQEVYAATMSEIAAQNVYMSQNKDTRKVIDGLLKSAAEELGKVTGSDPGDNHHKTEGRATIERAKRLAKRLPPKVRDAILKDIQTLEGKVPGGLK
jgi:RHS repeat-associated protein